MKVKNMTSASGNAVANQFIIEDCRINLNNRVFDGDMFQSYDSNIVFIPQPKHSNFENADCDKTYYTAYLDKKYWDYSVTTSKYRNQFLGETKKETQKKIDNGTYLLVNLN